MRCLVAVEDSLVLDTIAHAAGAFPDVEVDTTSVEECREQLRRRRYDFALIAYRTRDHESVELWDKIRDDAPELPLIALTPNAAIGGAKSDRARLKVFSWLGEPLDVVELYGTLRRVIDRVKKSGKVRSTVHH